jgi:type I restriction enzyme M protein
MNLNIIKSIQKTMRKDTGVDGDAQRLGQLVWMLFLKIFDDRETQWELLQNNYKSPIPEKYRWRNWAADPEGLTGEGLKSFIDNDMFPSLQNLEIKNQDQRSLVVRSVFEDAYNYMKSGQLLREVINKIQEDLDFNKSKERHLFGEMYEQLLQDLQSAGNAGEYYTPRAITDFMVNMMKPKLGEKILDTCCGTGGFLTGAIEYIRKKYVKTAEDENNLQSNILGYEKKPLPHLLCTTNFILHGIDVPYNIKHDNTLARPFISWTPNDRVDLILTNPPFGGIEEDGIETNFPSNFRTKETADLFMVLIMNLLRPNGRAAIVLPDSFLSGEGIKSRVKEKLLKEFNLHTIIRLPNSVFQPYASVATNLLFFEKGKSTKKIWYYEHQLPKDYKAYSKTKPIRLEEFEPIKLWWNKRIENKNAWSVNIDTIKEKNYVLDIKNPNQRVDEIFLSSKEIFENLKASIDKTDILLKEIEKNIYKKG